MRRIALAFALLAATVVLAGCQGGWDWSDPFHPTVERPHNYKP